jgi:branched-chain amino acid transport system permease protein
VQTLVNGLLLGSNYALLAIGYTLVFGVVRLLTLAHGQVFMVSGMVAVLALGVLHVPVAVAVLIALVAGTAAGIATDLLCFRPVRRESEIAPAVATIGFGIALQNAVVLLRGSSDPAVLPADLEAVDLRIGPVLVSSVQLATLILAVLLMVGIHLFVRRTRWGAALRAMGENPAAVELVGVNPRMLATVTLAASGLLAGAASVLLALRVGSVGPFSGLGIGLIGLAIISIAGMGNLTGATVVGLGLGVVEAFAQRYGFGGWEPALPWLLVIALLLIRPQGLFGTRRT